MSDIKDFLIENGVLIKYVGNGGNVVIPDGVTEIGEGAFAKCYELTGIVIGTEVQVIGNNAFFWCRKLEKVCIGENVSKIGIGAFSCCDKLYDITIPESVMVVDMFAFNNAGLRQVTILGSETQIHASSFDGMGNWQLICAPNISLEKIPKSCKFNAAIGFLSMWANNVTISEGVAEEYDKYIRRIKKKLLDEHILRYKKIHALRYILSHKLIKKTEIDDMIEKTQKMQATEMTAALMEYLDKQFGIGIEQSADRENAKEKELKQKKSAAERQLEMRKNPNTPAKKLWNVKILPDNTCRISAYKGIFEELIIPDEIDGHPVSEIGNRDDFLSNREGYPIIKSVSLPQSLRVIGRNAFSGTNIETIDIPEGVTRIEKHAFAFCTELKSIHLPETLVFLGKEMFHGCEKLEIINIPPHIQMIPKEMFDSDYFGRKCRQLKHVYIEGFDTTIENGVFSSCINLVKVEEFIDEKGQYSDKAEFAYKNLTIHAPAGSYAEQYAKENNIPFVAE